MARLSNGYCTSKEKSNQSFNLKGMPPKGPKLSGTSKLIFSVYNLTWLVGYIPDFVEISFFSKKKKKNPPLGKVERM